MLCSLTRKRSATKRTRALEQYPSLARTIRVLLLPFLASIWGETPSPLFGYEPSISLFGNPVKNGCLLVGRGNHPGFDQSGGNEHHLLLRSRLHHCGMIQIDVGIGVAGRRWGDERGGSERGNR